MKKKGFEELKAFEAALSSLRHIEETWFKTTKPRLFKELGSDPDITFFPNQIVSVHFPHLGTYSGPRDWAKVMAWFLGPHAGGM